MWSENVLPTLCGHWPTWQITIEHPADGEERVETMEPGDPIYGKIEKLDTNGHPVTI